MDSRLSLLRKRVNKARHFPDNTCPASRHVHIMAECLLNGGYPMLTDEPEHCAESMLAVVAALWEARTQLAKPYPLDKPDPKPEAQDKSTSVV